MKAAGRAGRRLLVERVASGRPVAHVAAEMGVSRATAHKWVRAVAGRGEDPAEPPSPSLTTRPRHRRVRPPAAAGRATVTVVGERRPAARSLPRRQLVREQHPASFPDRPATPRPPPPAAHSNRTGQQVAPDLVRVETPTPGRPSGRGGNSRSGRRGCIDRGTGAARAGNTETTRSSTPPGSGPLGRGSPPRTRTRTHFCRRTVS
ncbi:leucine zipper domain-containing protein [Streptomyces sp900116325]|uniref:Leucine zipper domain-containing protein n=1 Tax=Streptomyces sp. 900116325 TaxID=3154295 RepID=A0ABV2U673_9ACTN